MIKKSKKRNAGFIFSWNDSTSNINGKSSFEYIALRPNFSDWIIGNVYNSPAFNL